MSSHDETKQQQQQLRILELPLPTYEEAMRQKPSTGVFTISDSRLHYVEPPRGAYLKDGNRLYANPDYRPPPPIIVPEEGCCMKKIRYSIFKNTLYIITAFSLLFVFLLLLKDFHLLVRVKYEYD